MQLREREGLHGRCEGERTSLVEVKIRECWSSLVGRASHEFGTVRESREGLPRGYGLYGQGAIDGLLVMESNQEQLSTVFEYDADEAVSKVDGNYELEPRVDRHSPASARASASPPPPNQNPKHKSA